MSATAPVATRSGASPDAPPDHRRWLVLAIVLVAEVMDLIDGTIVNIAAPSIRRDLGGSVTTLQWYGAAYTLAFAVFLITGARLGDLIPAQSVPRRDRRVHDRIGRVRGGSELRLPDRDAPRAGRVRRAAHPAGFRNDQGGLP